MRRVQGHLQRDRRLPVTRSSGDDRQLRIVEPSGHIVELGKPALHLFGLQLATEAPMMPGHRLGSQFPDRTHRSALGRLLAELHQKTFGLASQFLRDGRHLACLERHRPEQRDQASQFILFLDSFHIGRHIPVVAHIQHIGQQERQTA